MASGVSSWSTTAATNATADSTINWAEGMAPSAVNDSARAMMARVADWRDSLNGTNATTGGTTAYVLTSDQTFAALAAGLEVAFQINATNTGTTTLNVDSLGAKPLRSAAGVELLAGSLYIGAVYRATYFTSNSGEWLIHGYPVLGDAQIAAAKLASNAVTTAKILDANVTLAKLADLATKTLIGRNTASTGVPEAATVAQVLNWLGTPARGDIIRQGAANPERLALGTSGYVLASDGTDTVWAAPKGRVLLNTLTASTSASLADTTSLTSTYKFYDLEIVNLVPATNGTEIQFQIYSSDYKTSGYLSSVTGAVLGAAIARSVTTFIPLAGAANDTANSAPGVSGKLRLQEPSVAGKCVVNGNITQKYSASDNIYTLQTSGYWNTAAVVTGFRFIATSGNLGSGAVYVYGYN